MDFKFIYSDNGTLTDYSNLVSNYKGNAINLPIVASEDAIFIGVRYPLNSFFLDVTVPNDATSAMSVSYWDGSEFRSVIEQIDETIDSGATLAQSGHLSFVHNRNYPIKSEDTQSTQGTENITGLGDVNIYERYWYKLTFSADLNALFSLNFLGYLFNSDDDIYSIYPDLVNYLDRYESGKTTWEEQSIKAAEFLIKDLIEANIIKSGNQIMNVKKLKNAAVFKVAEIIFTSFGSDYEDDRLTARTNYQSERKLSVYDVDKNNDGNLSTIETETRTGRLYR